MPVVVTLLLSKLSLHASRLLGRGGGSALPGLIADKLDPNLAIKLRPNFKTVILVTGTNGKTTTTKMLVEIMRVSGHTVITNPSGSNLKRGIVSRLIESASIFGHIDADTAIFEVDEASLPAVATALTPTSIAILNLFRDQLDRYGELDTTAALLGKVLAKNKHAVVYLNADDPLVASLADKAGEHVVFFGVESSDVKRLKHDDTADSAHSPYDGTALEYSKNWFGHLGHYKSIDGTFVRPGAEYYIKQHDNVLRMKLGDEPIVDVKLPLPGLYNAYNGLAAAAIATKNGVKIDVITSTLAHTAAAFGRVEHFTYHGRKVYLLLIKNPTGFNQVIQTFLATHKANSSIMIAINDNFADGRDVSWLWDAAVEEIAGRQPVVVSGVRGYDMALRLKYADRDAQVVGNVEAAFEEAVRQTPQGGTVYVLPTYTAMMELRKNLQKKTELAGFWHE